MTAHRVGQFLVGFLIFGTDIYTDSSSICTAAVHSGKITAKDGGEIIVTVLPGEEFYNGSKRNGVESQEYRSKWPGSFSVKKK